MADNEAPEKGESVVSAEGHTTEKQMSLDFMLDACFGFALSVSSVVVAYIESIWAIHDPLISGVFAVYMALVVASALGLGSILSERFQTKPGLHAMLIIYAVCLVGSLVLSLLQVYIVVAILAGACLACTGFIYSEFLVALPRHSLMTTVDILIMCIGVFMLAFTYGEGIALIIAQVVLATLALGMTLAYARKGAIPEHPISEDDSRARHIPLRGNRHSLFLIGFMFSIIAFGLWLQTGIEPRYMWLALGGVVAAAGLFSLMIKGLDERNYKDLLLKGMGAMSALLLLPATVLGGIPQFVCMCLFVFFATLEVIVCVNAVIESARFNMIAPIWLFGREGAVFFIGVAVGSLVILVGGWASSTYAEALDLTLCVFVVVCAFLQIRVNYQCYPFESALESTKTDEEIAIVQEQTGRYKTLWHQKIQTACDRYRLSPRECEVLQILLRGRDTKYVMDTFCISQSTAKTHIYNIYRKFDIHSRQDLLDFIEEIDPEGPSAE